MFLRLLFFFFLMMQMPFVARASDEAEFKRYYAEGVRLFQDKKYDEAVEILADAIGINPGVPQVYNVLGLALMSQKTMLGNAVYAFQKSIELNPNYPDPYNNLAVMYMSEFKNVPLAEEYFNKALKCDPKYERAWLGLGWLYFSNGGEVTKANKCFQKAVNINPDMVEAQFGLGMTYVALGKNEMAIKPISQLRLKNRLEMALQIENLIHKTEGAAPQGSSQTQPADGKKTGQPPEGMKPKSSQNPSGPGGKKKG